ncbi:HAD family hydrolase [Sorangium sp. So ce131]|uniref:HAD family hydrolase n=1 Tax=Sorangium sp. So ce131 TaxID=3133282 RepID=UPI003F6165CF
MPGLVFPSGTFAAYLFDCDGTIADSMPVHRQAWMEALAPHGCEFTDEDFYGSAGMPTDHIVALLNRKYGLRMPVAEVFTAKEEAYYRLMPTVRGVPEVVAALRGAPPGVKRAVVSGSPRVSVEKTLEFLGLRGYVDEVVAAEDYAHPKPAPDPFLEAARRLGVAPAQCLVFEDAALGIQSAQAAGMPWVLVDPRALRAARPRRSVT